MISEEISQKVISVYNNGEKSFNEVARLCSVNNVSVKTILKRKGIKLHNKSKFYRKYKLNEDYFQDINTEKKAYFLGLILADGCVHKRRLTISLQEEDRYILEKFIRELKFTGNLYKIKPRNPNHKIQYNLTIVSEKIIKDLNRLGIIERKSLVVKFPKIDDNLIVHFIRGVFDGDGSVFKTIRKTGREEVKAEFVGSIPFINELAKYIQKQDINVNGIKLVNNNKNASIYFSSKESLLKLSPS